MPTLFDPFVVRGVTLRNRIGMSPMCQYSCEDGIAGDWHLVHYGARAAGGVGLIIVEAAAVEPRGRISPGDIGLWNDKHIDPLSRITKFIISQGAVPGIQIAHAGRKAGTARPWEGAKPLDAAHGGWEPIAPSAVAYDDGYPVPTEMTPQDIADVRGGFVAAAKRAAAAGFASDSSSLSHRLLGGLDNGLKHLGRR